MNRREIIFLNPVFTHNVWGGTRLKEDYGYEIEGRDIGECWGISAHEHGDCLVSRGSYQGRKLSELWREEPGLFANTESRCFPLLIKTIAAEADLSIQVHPDDAYAFAHEHGASGKAECWYILDCDEGASVIIGHNAMTREQLVMMVREQRWGELFRELPVKKGDLIQIDPGTVHAAKGGMLLLEIQQNSDITYRIYDYGRLYNGQLRPLHIRQGLDVIAVPAKPTGDCVADSSSAPGNTWHVLTVCNYCKVWKLALSGEIVFEQNQYFLLLSIIEGAGMVDDVPVKKGDYMILPFGYGSVSMSGDMEVIAVCENRNL